MPVPKIETQKPSNIVATKPGIITKMITRNGTPKVKIGDMVKKGDILVSGVVDVIGDFDALIRKKLVTADADIVCKSYYDYNESFSMKYIKKIYTGRKQQKLSFEAMNKKISLYSPRISYKSYDIIMDETVLKLSWNFYLPLRYQITTYQEYISKQQMYTEDEARSIAMTRLKEYMDTLVNHGVEILENNVTIKIDKNTCTTSGKLVVYESCWDYKQIEENEWRDNNTDELNGNNH